MKIRIPVHRNSLLVKRKEKYCLICLYFLVSSVFWLQYMIWWRFLGACITHLMLGLFLCFHMMHRTICFFFCYSYLVSVMSERVYNNVVSRVANREESYHLSWLMTFWDDPLLKFPTLVFQHMYHLIVEDKCDAIFLDDGESHVSWRPPCYYCFPFFLFEWENVLYVVIIPRESVMIFASNSVFLFSSRREALCWFKLKQ